MKLILSNSLIEVDATELDVQFKDMIEHHQGTPGHIEIRYEDLPKLVKFLTTLIESNDEEG